MATGSARTQRDFFEMIPRRSLAVFLLAVFFVFAPVGLLVVSSFEQERPLGPVLLYISVSGLVAVSWAGTFTYSRWFIVGIVVFTAALMMLSGPYARTALGLRSSRASLEGFLLVGTIVAGYFLFLAFISGQGRTTMRLMTEMSLARRIHDKLVPSIDRIHDRAEVLGSSSASTEMGGDLIDLIEHDGGIDLFLADVSGHGVRAGVVMGMVKAAIRTQSMRRQPLGELARDVNGVLEQITSPELYATMASLRIGDANGRVEWSLAGHHHIVHYRATTGTVDRWGGPSFPLGMMPGQEYETHGAEVEAGDLLALYTDGLNETTDAADRELGHEAIEQSLVRNASAPLREMHDAVLELVRKHGDQVDDRTLLLVRLR